MDRIEAEQCVLSRPWLATLPPGWLSETEALLLSSLADGKVVLEIGAYLGRSTAALARTALTVVSVDWHQGDAGTRGSGHPAEGWTFPTFMEHMDRLLLSPKIVPVVGRVSTVAPLLAADSFDLVWIDGAHDSDSVGIDTALALRTVKPGGVIAWHDWDYATVRAGAARHLDALAVHQPEGTRIATWTKERTSA